MKLGIALVNTKPGTAKTTSGFMLAYALHKRGEDVVLFDADPAGSTLAWSDAIGGCPFDVVGLPQNQPGTKLGAYTRPDSIAVVDNPQAEDHGKVVRSILRVVDEAVVTVAPSLIEIERTSLMAEVLEEVEETRNEPLRTSVLLNRVASRAESGPMAREALAGAGYDVLASEIPRLDLYPMAYGRVPSAAALAPFEPLAAELLARAGA
uniref:PSQ10.12c n=1 Tax=Nocardiopsis sp. 90127 TaxID=373213 RepID=Q27I76_9ACTN|nr:ParA family protein [Nocardiopsis sp. 90127]ABD48735.1 pSQ10.12c [Nocardiopsis sp. 90127]